MLRGGKKSASYRVSSNCLGGGPHTNQRHTLVGVKHNGRSPIWEWFIPPISGDDWGMGIASPTFRGVVTSKKTPFTLC